MVHLRKTTSWVSESFFYLSVPSLSWEIVVCSSSENGTKKAERFFQTRTAQSRLQLIPEVVAAIEQFAVGCVAHTELHRIRQAPTKYSTSTNEGTVQYQYERWLTGLLPGK